MKNPPNTLCSRAIRIAAFIALVIPYNGPSAEETADDAEGPTDPETQQQPHSLIVIEQSAGMFDYDPQGIRYRAVKTLQAVAQGETRVSVMEYGLSPLARGQELKSGQDFNPSPPVDGELFLGEIMGVIERATTWLENSKPHASQRRIFLIANTLPTVDKENAAIFMGHPLLKEKMPALFESGVELYIIRATEKKEPGMLSQRLRDSDIPNTNTGILRDRWARTADEIPTTLSLLYLVSTGRNARTPLTRPRGRQTQFIYKVSRDEDLLEVFVFYGGKSNSNAFLESPNKMRPTPKYKSDAVDIYAITHAERGNWVLSARHKKNASIRTIFSKKGKKPPQSTAKEKKEEAPKDQQEDEKPGATNPLNIILMAVSGLLIIVILALVFLLIRSKRSGTENDAESDITPENAPDTEATEGKK